MKTLASRHLAALILVTAVLGWHCSVTERAAFDEVAGADGGNGGFDGGGCSPPALTAAAPQEVVAAFEAAVSDDDVSAAAPDVYEPRAEAAFPRDWHTLHVLLRSPETTYFEMSFTVGDRKARYVGPLASVPDARSVAWRSSAIPSALWKGISCLATNSSSEVKWKPRTLDTGQSTPGRATRGTIAVLPFDTAADVTFWQVDGPSGTIERIKGSTATKQTVVKERTCVGCHVTTPDGQDVAYQTPLVLQPDAGGLPPAVDGGGAGAGGPSGPTPTRIKVTHPSEGGDGQMPSYVTSAAARLLTDHCLARPAVSAAAWAAGGASGRYLAVSLCDDETNGGVGVLQLDAPSDPLHVVQREGDTAFAVEPAWSPKGDFIVYTATRSARASSGFPDPSADGDLVRVPIDLARGVFGGAAVKLLGAAEADIKESQPTISPDGELVAFTRVSPSAGGPGRGIGGEIWVVPAVGGTAVRLAGDDDPPMAEVFVGARSSWARFAPELARVGDDTYYALAFSSGRGPGKLADSSPFARMFFAFMKRDSAGKLSRLGLTLVPGQTFGEHNLTLDARALASVRAPDAVK